MLQLKIGIQLASLKLPFKKALLTAAQLGADAVEIDARHELPLDELSRTGVRHVRKMLEDLNLRACALAFPTRRGYDVLEDLDRHIDATKRALQFAYDLGAERGGQQHWPHSCRCGSGELDHAHRFARRYWPLWPARGRHAIAETVAESGEDFLRLLKALPDGSLGINLDPGNLIVSGHSPVDATRLLGRHVLHVHAKDGVRDVAQGRGVEVPLGRGSCEFPVLLAILEQHEYRGYVTIERQNSSDPIGEIATAVKFLKPVTAAPSPGLSLGERR